MAGPVEPPAAFGFGYLGTVSHEFFRPLSVTFDFTAMTAFIATRRRLRVTPGRAGVVARDSV